MLLRRRERNSQISGHSTLTPAKISSFLIYLCSECQINIPVSLYILLKGHIILIIQSPVRFHLGYTRLTSYLISWYYGEIEHENMGNRTGCYPQTHGFESITSMVIEQVSHTQGQKNQNPIIIIIIIIIIITILPNILNIFGFSNA